MSPHNPASALNDLTKSDNAIVASVIALSEGMGSLKTTVENSMGVQRDIREALVKVIENQAEQKAQLQQFNFGYSQLKEDFNLQRTEVSNALRKIDAHEVRVARLEMIVFGDKDNETDGMVTNVRLLMKSEEKRDTIWGLAGALWAAGGASIVGALAWIITAYMNHRDAISSISPGG